MEEEIKIQIFDGKNYNIWKKRIFMYLKWKKCDEAAVRVKLPTDNEMTETISSQSITYIAVSIMTN